MKPEQLKEYTEWKTWFEGLNEKDKTQCSLLVALGLAIGIRLREACLAARDTMMSKDEKEIPSELPMAKLSAE